MSYYLGLYRYHAPFPVDVVARAMEIIARWLPGFLPASMVVARRRSIPLASPADFDASLVPAAFVIWPGRSTRIPIDGGDGTALVIKDDRAPDPDVAPANIRITFIAPLPLPARLEGLTGDLIEAFLPDSAQLTDDETPGDKDVEHRRIVVDNAKAPPWFSWLTWLNPGLIEAAGPEALARLSALCPVRPLAGGAIVRVQDEPTDGNDPAWSRRRQAAEDAFGLASLHRRFPRIVE